MSTTNLSRVELNALWTVGNGEAIPRPVRRRLEGAGLIKHSTLARKTGDRFKALTPLGLKILEDNAPRSEWSPPQQQYSHPIGPNPRNVGRMSSSRLTALTLVAAISAINPR